MSNGTWPLWEGKQFHQFDAQYALPRYWLDEEKAKSELRGARLRKISRELKAYGLAEQVEENDVRLDCDAYRLAFRDIARSSDARTVIACVLPPGRFCPHTVSLESVFADRVDASGYRSVERLRPVNRLYVLALFEQPDV